MVVTSLPGSRNISSVMQDVKYSLKARFSIFLTAPLVERSSGWRRCVMFLGTMTLMIFSSFRRRLWRIFQLRSVLNKPATDSTLC